MYTKQTFPQLGVQAKQWTQQIRHLPCPYLYETNRNSAWTEILGQHFT